MKIPYPLSPSAPRPPSPRPVPSRPSIPRPSYNRPSVIINNHYHSGYGGGYYHPWYHPVFVWPTYGNYSTGAVGGVESGIFGLLIVALVVGAIFAGWRTFR